MAPTIHLMASLSLEKDPANIARLLETFLVYIATFQKSNNNKESNNHIKSKLLSPWILQDNGADETQIDPNLFAKSMSKILRKACYGAPSQQWSPTILPLLASLPYECNHNDGQLQMHILSSLWEGRKEAVGNIDEISIVSAVVV